jgi:CelD/BcsL family acetyltransferase involved in cellulose biosynthesis
LIADHFADMPHASLTGRTTVDVLTAIDHVDRTEWQSVLARGDTNVVFLTSEWQRAWWDAYGRGRLLLVTVRRDGELIALGSLFAEDGFIYFVGSGGSDYLDFIGDISCPQVIDALLLAARSQVEDFIGFRFYLVPARSRTAEFLERAAERLGMYFCDEGAIEAPFLDLTAPGAAHAAVNKKSLLRHERFFERTERIDVREMCRAEDILPHLDDFFAQHIRRWESTEWPSPFRKERHRKFYRRLVGEASDAGWLRFTRIEWQGRAIAAHFGFCYNGSYLWYKPAFSIDLARHSPGEVLLRRLLLSAIDEKAAIFDFGIGNEAFKQRFATAIPLVKTWGLYAPGRQPPPNDYGD